MSYNLPLHHFHIVEKELVLPDTRVLLEGTVVCIANIAFGTSFNNPMTPSVNLRTLKKWNQHKKKDDILRWKEKDHYNSALSCPLNGRQWIRNIYSMNYFFPPL